MLRALPLLPVLLLAAPALAVGFQDTTAIDKAVASFTGHPIGEDGGARTAVDGKLRLPSCPMVSLAWHGAVRDAVMVSCTGPDWKIYVPVRFAPTAPPTPAAAAPVKLPPVIKRGDPILVEAGAPGFAISREGVAMGDAAPGARFLVKVDDVKTPIQAVAVESGRATLPGWEANGG